MNNLELIINDLKEKDENINYKYTYKQISEKYNISIYEITKIVKKYNLQRTFERKKYLKDYTNLELIIKDLKELDENGKYKYSYQDIAKKYGIYHSKVAYIARKYNLTHTIKPYRKDNKKGVSIL